MQIITCDHFGVIVSDDGYANVIEEYGGGHVCRKCEKIANAKIMGIREFHLSESERERKNFMAAFMSNRNRAVALSNKEKEPSKNKWFYQLWH